MKLTFSSGIPLNCDNCGETTFPACHLAMSDASIRNFCDLRCAMAFKVMKKKVCTAFKSLTVYKKLTKLSALKNEASAEML